MKGRNGMYFTTTPEGNRMEVLMKKPPGFVQRGGGRRRPYRFIKQDCDCHCCLHYHRKSCTVSECPFLEIRLECGAASFYEAVRAAFDHAAGTGEPPCAFWLGFERNAQAPWDQLQAPASGIFCFRPRGESLPAVLRQGRREHANSLRRKRQIPLRHKERCIFRQALFQAVQQRTVKFRRLSQKIKETALRAALGQCVQRRLVRQPFRYDRVVHHAQRLDVQIGNACASIRKNAAACERTRLIFRNCYNFFTICGQIEGN